MVSAQMTRDFPGFRCHESAPQAQAELIDAFRTKATAVISNNLGRLPAAVGLRPFHRDGAALTGTALTVRERSGDISPSPRRWNWYGLAMSSSSMAAAMCPAPW
jgi:regulator of RNase E activity RraA